MNKQINILLVDDNKQEQDRFSLALNDLKISYLCRFAVNKKEALRLLNKLLPDFIFINMNMPQINGFDCLKQIKKARIIKNTTVILYSNNVDETMCKKALKLGVSACIRKTSQVSELIVILKKICTKNFTSENFRIN